MRLNLGYTFSDPIKWDIDRIQGGKSRSYSAGASFDIGSSSFSSGVDLTTSANEEKFNLTDINSDGLPDKVWLDNDVVRVALNNGTSFEEPIIWKNVKALSNTSSTSESMNAAFTTTVQFLVKIAINPGASAS